MDEEKPLYCEDCGEEADKCQKCGESFPEGSKVVCLNMEGFTKHFCSENHAREYLSSEDFLKFLREEQFLTDSKAVQED